MTKRFLLSLFMFLALSLAALTTLATPLCTPPSFAQDTPAARDAQPAPDTQPASVATQQAPPAGQSSLRNLFYAYLGEQPESSAGPVETLVVEKLFPGKTVEQKPFGMQKYRPMLQLRYWANQRQHFFPAFAFCLGAASILWIPFGKKLEAAASISRSRFWRSLFVGLMVSMVTLFLAKLFFVSGVGWPAGILTIATLQLAMTGGIVVMTNIIGEAIARVLRLTHVSFIAERPVVQRGVFLFIGSVILAGVILIPGPGKLPPIGTRLIMLFALVGLGALYKSHFDRTSD